MFRKCRPARPQEYLRQFHELFGITLDELRSLSLAPAERPEPLDVDYRFLTEKTQFDTTVVTGPSGFLCMSSTITPATRRTSTLSPRTGRSSP